jgi:hypothetical protein
VEHDFIMATYLADRVVVYEGEPSVHCVATAPQVCFVLLLFVLFLLFFLFLLLARVCFFFHWLSCATPLVSSWFSCTHICVAAGDRHEPVLGPAEHHVPS